MTDDDTIGGRAEIAFRLSRSERKISRWVRRGILPARPVGPRAADLERLKHGEGEDD
jgi:hypothetical protein